MDRNNKNVLKQMKDRIKSWSGNNSSLSFALQEEKETQRLAERFAATKNNAAATMLQWSKGEQNQLFVQVFGKIAELNWMWKTALDEFSNQYLNYQQQLKVLYDTEKEIDEHNKELLACHSKVVKAKKQLEAAVKKGDESRIVARDDEYKAIISQYSTMKLTVAAAITQLELKKVARVQAALKEQASAFVNLAGKCQAIFTAQRAMTAIFPQNDVTTSASNYQVFFDNLGKIIGSLCKKLGMTPPRDGGINLYEAAEVPESTSPPSPPDYGAVTKSGGRHSTYVDSEKIAEIKDTGNIGLPVPPRSQQSLEIPSYYYYVIPNEANRRPVSQTVLGYTKIILGDDEVYAGDEIYADNAEDDGKIYDSVAQEQPRIPQLQETKDMQNRDLWYAVTVVDKEKKEEDALRLSRSYSDPQIIYEGTGTEMRLQSPEHLDEEKLAQSLSLPNAHPLKNSYSASPSRNESPFSPVDDFVQENISQETRPEEESIVSLVQIDTNQLNELNSFPTPQLSDDHESSTEEESSLPTEAEQTGVLQTHLKFTDVTVSPPSSLADHDFSTKALRSQKSGVIPSQSSLPCNAKLSSPLSGPLSPQRKVDHQASQPHESKEKSSQAQHKNVSTSTSQSPTPSTKPSKPQKPQMISSRSPFQPSAKLSSSLSALQGKTDHLLSQPQGPEKEKSPKLPDVNQFQSPPPPKFLSTPSLECKTSDLSVADTSQIQEGSPPSDIIEQSCEMQKAKVKRHSIGSMKGRRSGNTKFTQMGRLSPVQKGLCATQSLDVVDGVSVNSKLHLSRSSRSLDNVGSDAIPEEAKPSLSAKIPENSQTATNDSINVDQNTSPTITGVKSHSVGQLDNMAELNKDVYSFVANALQPQSTPNTNQSSLSDIFKKHCQKFEQLTKPDIQSPEVSQKGKDDAKIIAKSSQQQKGAGPQKKKPQLPPRPKEITK